ncbi:MAG TPA: MFS transporter, partial [Aggregatilineales bacterium]|nr:MFS transporter [Aggregatilineales bacterium]
VALIVDAATFAIAGGLVMLIIMPPEANEIPVESSTHFSDLIEGFRYVRRNPDVGIVTLAKGAMQITGSVDVIAAIYATKIFIVGEDGATTLGLLFMAHGFGAVLGPLLGDRMTDRSEGSLKDWISIGFGLSVVGWVLLAAAPNLFIAWCAMVLRGMGGSINWTYSSVLIQMKVPDNFLGRVFGLDFTLFTLGLSVAVIIPGLVMDEFSITPRRFVLYIAAATFIVLLAWISALRIKTPAPASAAAD